MQTVLQFLENYFVIIWLVAVCAILGFLVLGGKKAMKMFDSVDKDDIVYLKTGFSGKSDKSVLTKMGGGSKVVHVQLTSNEFILKTNTFMAHAAKMADLLHRVPYSKIKSIRLDGRKLKISFSVSSGEIRTIDLISKHNQELKQMLENYV